MLVRIVSKTKKTTRIELCFEIRPRRHVLSTIYSEEDRMATNKETILKTFEMRNDTSVQEKEKNFHWVLLSGDDRVMTIRNAPTCEDLHHLWTQHCED